jgi:hypothetical protein
LPEFGQRIAAEHRSEQEPVRLQRAADLREHAGQIVDELEGQRGDHEIERLRRQTERFRLAEADRIDRSDTPAQGVPEPVTRRPEIGRRRKAARYRLQTVRHVCGDTLEQERRRPRAPGARQPRGEQCAIEQVGSGGRVRCHAGWLRRTAVAGNAP